MAATAAARQLTEQHRRAQLRLGSQVATQLLAAWQLLDPADLDGTFDRWLAAVLPIVDGQRTKSARLAGNYLEVFKRLELGGTVSVPLILDETVDAARFATSMVVTGPASIKKAMTRGQTLERAVDVAQVRTIGAAVRHTLDGGRSTVNMTLSADRQALGYARATSGAPCYFCAMLASRGAVYKGEDTAGFQPHDSCACQPEPVYRDDSRMPPGNERWSDMWQQAKEQARDEGTYDPAPIFRRLVESA